ncbi:Phage major capsid protein, P2 family [compost metagenome]
MLITRLDNLSIYWQDGTHRRHVEEVPKRDRIENYESINEDYVVEDYGCGCLIENIEVTAGADDKDGKAELSKFTSAIVDAIKTASGTSAPAAQE